MLYKHTMLYKCHLSLALVLGKHLWDYLTNKPSYNQAVWFSAAQIIHIDLEVHHT